MSKWSVSVEEALAARAVEHEHDLLDEYLVELDARFGPVPPGSVERYDELWPS